jgi:peptidoglycan/xylan/chitin deacetylase (PgdA/CDA1 family)
MILEPNRRRRALVLRALAGVLAVVAVTIVFANGWVPPLTSAIPSSAPTLAPSVISTLVLIPSTVPPSPSPAASPTASAPPSPIPSLVGGCQPAPTGIMPAVVASHGARTQKVVALTFDDGTNSANVLKILKILQHEHTNATFFPTGRSVELDPDLWRKVAQAGFPIGDHTYSHRSLLGLCYADQLAELIRAKTVLDGLGIPMLPAMRPPYEEFDDTTLLAATSAGAGTVVLWDVDTLDWTGVRASTIVARALAGREGSIVLMHTAPTTTSTALATIIDRYRHRGFTFVTIGTLLTIPGPVPFS